MVEMTENKIDDLVFESLKPHILLLFLVIGLYCGAQAAPVSAKVLSAVEKMSLALLIMSLSFAVSHFLSGYVRIHASRLSIAQPTTSLTENLIRTMIFSLGLLLVLSNLGISIAPLLTALGVGSLAVALALKDTLSDLFAGIYIILNRQIRVGDYIKLHGGQEGYVVDIGWKVTRVRELSNNVIVIPNSNLSQSVLTNYYLPEKEMSVVIQVGVSYDSDLDNVEKITIDVARQIQKDIQGGVREFDPFIRYHTFGESSVNFSVILRVREYVDKHLLTHEFVKKLHARYNKEGITIPYPQRVLHLERSTEKMVQGG